MRRVHVQVGSKCMGININICTSTSTCTRHPRHQRPVLVGLLLDHSMPQVPMDEHLPLGDITNVPSRQGVRDINKKGKC